MSYFWAWNEGMHIVLSNSEEKPGSRAKQEQKEFFSKRIQALFPNPYLMHNIILSSTLLCKISYDFAMSLLPFLGHEVHEDREDAFQRKQPGRRLLFHLL